VVRRAEIWLYLFFLCGAFAYLCLSNKDALSETVFFRQGDEWSYQVLAVNLLHGHGFQDGGVEPWETYQFDPQSKRQYEIDSYSPQGTPVTLRESFEKLRQYYFFRTPGYPFFLALIYRVFGVHPAIVKVIQMMLLALVAAWMLPWIGRHYWGQWGMFSGLVAGLLFLVYFCPPPAKLLTESLITFALGLWAVLFVFWEKKSGLLSIFTLGLASGLLLLIKGSNIFIPIFFFVYLICVKRFREVVVPAAAFVGGMALLLVPWSVYASAKKGEFIFLSTQPRVILLDGNNEDSLKDGGWHVQWRTDPKNRSYLYNRLEESNSSPLKKAMIFFSENKKDLPGFFLSKVLRAFPVNHNLLFSLVMLAMISYYAFQLLHRAGMEKAPIFPIFFLLNHLLITLIFFGEIRYTLPFMPFFLLVAVYFFPLLMKEGMKGRLK
jgi:hypothetical protein